VRYMQIQGGQKLHLVYEPGEGPDDQHLIRAGHLSAPICGRGFNKNGGFKMSINVPLGNACKKCLRLREGNFPTKWKHRRMNEKRPHQSPHLSGERIASMPRDDARRRKSQRRRWPNGGLKIETGRAF